jgi:hypothetical protein
VCSVLKTNHGTIALWRHNYCRKLLKSLDPIQCSAGGESTVLLVSAKWGKCPQSEKTKAFLEGIFRNCTVRHGLWDPQSPDLTSPDFFLWRFHKETVYSNKPRSLEDLKHKAKQAVALTNQQSLTIQISKHCGKGECLSSKRWGTFSASVVITHRLSHS